MEEKISLADFVLDTKIALEGVFEAEFTEGQGIIEITFPSGQTFVLSATEK